MDLREAFDSALNEAIERARDELVSKSASRPARDQEAREIANQIFDSWYHHGDKTGGGSYYFLFRKSAYITNISFAELAALLRLHIKPIDNSDPQRIQFTSSKELKETFYDLLSSFWDASSDWKSSLADRCYSLFTSVIRFDAFYTSAVVHLPRNLSIDLFSICNDAGFIHSCGEAIYVRRVERATQSALARNLTKFVEEKIPAGKQAFFVPYSHQHFSEWDEKEITLIQELRHGLTGVKIHLDKYYFDGKPLPQMLREVIDSEDIGGKLLMPRGVGHYHSERRDFSKNENAESALTIFMIVDQSLTRDSEYPEFDNYYFVYAQRYKNSNPLLYFDEEKPAWIAPVTLPQNLASAMINISRSQMRQSRKFSICDPFVGTGTTLLEALKLRNVSSFSANDIHPLTKLIVSDNASFFALTDVELERLGTEIMNLIKFLRDGKPTIDEKVLTDFEWAKEQVVEIIASPDLADTSYPRTLQSSILPSGLKTALEKVSFRHKRLFFYLIWRAAVKNWYVLGTRDDGFDRAIENELRKICESIDRFKILRSAQNISARPDAFAIHHFGTYSLECTIGGEVFANWEKRCRITQIDAVEFLKAKVAEFDVIVTDPPYGFNVEVGDREELAKLFAHAIPSMIDALKDDGQLIFCLPHDANTGQVIPAFVMKDIVAQEVLLAAERSGKEVIRTAEKYPHPRSNFEPPYYWRSERALRRSILHFRFRDKLRH